jgi:hypothetical protein
MITTSMSLTRRDKAVLAAVAAGRGTVAGGALLIDGRCCSDQFAFSRLRAAGLLAPAGVGAASLTDDGERTLVAA